MTMSSALFADDPFKVTDSAAKSSSRKKSSSGSSGEKKSHSSRSSSSKEGGGSSSRSKEGRSSGERQRSSGDREHRRARRQSESHDSPQDAFGFADNGFSDQSFDPSFDTSFDAPAPAPAAPAAGGRQRRVRRASISAGALSHSDHKPPEEAPQVDDYGFEDHAPASATPDPAPRARRGRRSSMYGDSGPSSRHVTGVRSCEGLEQMQISAADRTSRAGRSLRSGDSVASGESNMSGASAGSGGAEPPRRARRGRRASVSGGSGPPVDHHAAHGVDPAPGGFGDFGGSNDVDYGYGDTHPDYGYGDSNEKEEAPAQRAPRRQRSNAGNLLEDLKSGDFTASAARGGQSTRNIGAGAGANSMIAPMVLPMNEPEKAPRPRRRASLIGAVGGVLGGGPKKPEEVEKAPTYDPSLDRDRRAAGGLLQSIGAADGAPGLANGARTSYSDRIMTKSR